jgi:hypothetical protein
LAVARIAVGNDFDVLLQDLSFGNPPEAVEPVAEALQEVAVEDVGPAADGFVMPAPEAPVAITESEPLVGDEALIEMPREDGVDPSDIKVDFNQVFTSQEVSASDDALAPVEDVPAPLRDGVAPPPQPEPLPLSPEPMVASPIIDPAYAEGYCGSCGGGCDHGRGHHVTCIPHLPPNLPYSTFLQYFRSNKCYSNVWQGYQQKCGLGHDHIHGTCDCFNPHRKNCFGVSDCQCGNCDACDR